jgi:hypothetical protein
MRRVEETVTVGQATSPKGTNHMCTFARESIIKTKSG